MTPSLYASLYAIWPAPASIFHNKGLTTAKRNEAAKIRRGIVLYARYAQVTV